MSSLTENPLSKESVQLMRNHVRDVARQHKITVDYEEGGPFFDASSDPLTNNVRIAQINGPITYATALHELGHLIHPQGSLLRVNYSSTFYRKMGYRLPWDNDVSIVEESMAWEWAVRNAIVWTPSMSRSAAWAYGTYERARIEDRKAYEKFISDPVNAFLLITLDDMDKRFWAMRKPITRELVKKGRALFF